MRAFSAKEIYKMKKETIPFTGEFEEAFGHPEWVGIWFIWGGSAEGKTRLALRLLKELARWKPTALNSLEQKASLTMANSIREENMQQCKPGRFKLIPGESMDELSERLSKPKAPAVVAIDSFQYTQMSYKDYIAFKEKHPDKLIIFISHADGKQPDGRAAKKIKYDAELKIHVEGFRAISHGRTQGEKGYYTIWKEGAEKIWGKENI